MDLKFKLPTMGQLKRLPSILDKTEKAAIVFLVLVLAGVFARSMVGSYIENTKSVPIKGGAYIEGMIGSPQYINPVISQASDVDELISKLIYSSLFKFDSQGKMVNDLVDSYAISEDGKSYEISLKKNVKWKDPNPLNAGAYYLTAEDVIYTASIIKDPVYKSPLRANLEGLTFEKLDDYTLTITTKAVFGQALSTLTFGILPKYKWEKVNPESFTLFGLNIKPEGSGPYMFDNFVLDKGTGRVLYYQLKTNDDYYGEKPFLENAVFKFYSNMEDMVAAYNKEDIMAIGGMSVAEEEKFTKGLGTLQKVNIPQYFAVFFNPNKSKPLSDKIVRTALSNSVDKNYLVKEVFKENAITLEGPYLPYLSGYNPNTKIYDFAREYAKNILDSQGWKDSNNDNIRDKDGVNLEFTLLTGDNPELSASAKAISEMWTHIGVKADVKIVPLNELTNNYIRSREYDAVLFGEVLSLDSNPFVFWHTSQRKDPGLNLSVYSNKDVDKILEDTEATIDPAARAEKYKEFQRLVIEDVPAVFLYSPFYLFEVNNKIKGVEVKTLSFPPDRLNDISKWYMKTDRVQK